MKSIAIVIGHDKLHGLLDDPQAPFDSPGLTQCFNLRASQYGLEAPRPLTDPGTLPSAVSWPYPQLMRTRFHTLALYSNKIYLVDESTWAYTDVTPSGVVSNHMWTLVDMFGAWVLTNGSCVIWTKTPTRTNTPTTSPQLAAATTPTVSCCCRFRGRAFFAGFATNAQFGIWKHLGPNFVYWSDVGGGDVYLPWSGGKTTVDDHVVKSMIRQNLLGHMPMPSKGLVQRVEPLSDTTGGGVMVYSEDSINGLKAEIMPDGTQKFRLIELHEIGLKQRGLVASSLGRHFYVTADGSLWTVTTEFKPQRLGFTQFFGPVTGTWIGTYDTVNDEAYFSNGLSGYLVTRYGMTDLVVFPTSILPKIVPWGPELYAPTKDSAFGTDFSLVTTSTMRFNTQANVTLAMVEVGLRDISDAVLTPHCDYGNGMQTRSRTFRLSKTGVCFPRTTAPAMQVSITGDVTGSQKIDYIRMELQYPDRRFKRGIEGGGT